MEYTRMAPKTIIRRLKGAKPATGTVVIVRTCPGHVMLDSIMQMVGIIALSAITVIAAAIPSVLIFFIPSK